MLFSHPKNSFWTILSLLLYGNHTTWNHDCPRHYKPSTHTWRINSKKYHIMKFGDIAAHQNASAVFFIKGIWKSRKYRVLDICKYWLPHHSLYDNNWVLKPLSCLLAYNVSPIKPEVLSRCFLYMAWYIRHYGAQITTSMIENWPNFVNKSTINWNWHVWFRSYLANVFYSPTGSCAMNLVLIEIF